MRLLLSSTGRFKMDKFVLRGDDAVAAAATASTAGQRDHQRLRQTRIADGSKVVVEEAVRRLRDELDAAKTPAAMLRALQALEREHFVSLEMLEKTRIGVSLTRLQRRTESGRFGGERRSDGHCNLPLLYGACMLRGGAHARDAAAARVEEAREEGDAASRAARRDLRAQLRRLTKTHAHAVLRASLAI